jgi:peptide/nickel transport system permease protein
MTRNVLLGAGLLAVLALLGPWIAVRDPARQDADYAYAPPMRPHLVDTAGRLRAPFVYPLTMGDRLTRTYVEDTASPVVLRWFSGGRLVTADVPWFPLGADALGRDVFSRLVIGARYSLGVALAAVALTLAFGALAGGIAGLVGGITDDLLMRLADLVVTLPVLYVVVTLRAAMPLVLSPLETFWTVTLVLAAVGWPLAARGTRAIVAAERQREYAEAARAAGASRTRLLLRHLLPAARPYLATQATLLFPGFVLAEATLSYLGLGFPEPIPSWGAMLQAAPTGRGLLMAPWLLAPAAAIFAAVLVVHVLTDGRRRGDGPPALRL